MAEFLQQISRDYDYVIIDTPPLNVVSDALPIIRESDGVVIVVRANGSTHPEVQKVMESWSSLTPRCLALFTILQKISALVTPATSTAMTMGMATVTGMTLTQNNRIR